MEEKNKNIQVEDAKLLLSEASTLIDIGRAELIEVEILIDDVIDSENPKDSFIKVKDIVRQAVNNFKNAHKKIVEAIRSIKAQRDTYDDEDDGDDSEQNSTITP